MASDESLVLLMRDPDRLPRERSDAARELGARYKNLLCGRVVNEVENPDQFLAATGALSIEAFCGDVFGKAVATWKPGAGAKFSTWVYRLLTQAIIDGLRGLKKVPKRLADRDGEDRGGRIEDRSRDASPLDRLALLDALDLARACLDALPERSQQVFVWTVLLGMSYDEVRTIWPHISVDSLKQIKCRASAGFIVKWAARGGASVEETVQSLAGAVADRVDPARIRDARAREAYLVWVKLGSLEASAKELKVNEESLRGLLRQAMKDLFEQGMVRGEAIEKLKMTARDVARAIELAEAGEDQDPLARRIDHVLELARAAFGFSRPERAVHTLGSLVQSRLGKVEDYDRACRELALKPAALRKLLADDLDPDAGLVDRLAAFLDISADRVRALPRRPARGAPLLLRSASPFDEHAFLERVRSWVK